MRGKTMYQILASGRVVGFEWHKWCNSLWQSIMVRKSAVSVQLK